MTRSHVHLHADDPARRIGFHPKRLAAEPSRGARPGIVDLGFQVEDEAEPTGSKARAEAADMALPDEGRTGRCQARSKRRWVTDPQGIAGEQFRTLSDIVVLRAAAPASCSCCQ